MKLLVLSGVRHPYDESTPVLLSFLKEKGHEVTMTEDARELVSPDLSDYDAIVFNTRRADELTLARDEQHRLTLFVGKGGGLVVIHIASVRPEAWPQWHRPHRRGLGRRREPSPRLRPVHRKRGRQAAPLRRWHQGLHHQR